MGAPEHFSGRVCVRQRNSYMYEFRLAAATLMTPSWTMRVLGVWGTRDVSLGVTEHESTPGNSGVNKRIDG